MQRLSDCELNVLNAARDVKHWSINDMLACSIQHTTFIYIRIHERSAYHAHIARVCVCRYRVTPIARTYTHRHHTVRSVTIRIPIALTRTHHLCARDNTFNKHARRVLVIEFRFRVSSICLTPQLHRTINLQRSPNWC